MGPLGLGSFNVAGTGSTWGHVPPTPGLGLASSSSDGTTWEHGGGPPAPGLGLAFGAGGAPSRSAQDPAGDPAAPGPGGAWKSSRGVGRSTEVGETASGRVGRRREEHGSRGDRRGSFASPPCCEEGSCAVPPEPALVGRSPTVFQGAGTPVPPAEESTIFQGAGTPVPPVEVFFDDDEAPSSRGGTWRRGRGPIGRRDLPPRPSLDSVAPLDNGDHDGRPFALTRRTTTDDGDHDIGGPFALLGQPGTRPERPAALRPALRPAVRSSSVESPLRAPRGTRTTNNVRFVLTSTSSLGHLGIDPPTLASLTSCNTEFGFSSQSLSEIPGGTSSGTGSPVLRRGRPGARAATRWWDNESSRTARRCSSSSSDGFFHTTQHSSPEVGGRDAAASTDRPPNRSPPDPQVLEFLHGARLLPREEQECPRATTRRGVPHTPWHSGCSLSSLERYHATSTSFEAGSLVTKSSSRTGGGDHHANAADHGQHHCAAGVEQSVEKVDCSAPQGKTKNSRTTSPVEQDEDGSSAGEAPSRPQTPPKIVVVPPEEEPLSCFIDERTLSSCSGFAITDELVYELNRPTLPLHKRARLRTQTCPLPRAGCPGVCDPGLQIRICRGAPSSRASGEPGAAERGGTAERETSASSARSDASIDAACCCCAEGSEVAAEQDHEANSPSQGEGVPPEQRKKSDAVVSPRSVEDEDLRIGSGTVFFAEHLPQQLPPRRSEESSRSARRRLRKEDHERPPHEKCEGEESGDHDITARSTTDEAAKLVDSLDSAAASRRPRRSSRAQPWSISKDVPKKNEASPEDLEMLERA